MHQRALRDPILEDLEQLTPDLRRQIRELVHSMAVAQSAETSSGVLRFAIDHPLQQRKTQPISEATQSAPGPLLPPEAGPDDVLDKLRALLADGHVLMARRLASEAIERFPSHAEIGNAKRILNDGKATVSSGGPERSTEEEFAWLRNPPPWARGKWVALLGQEAVASGKTLAEVVEALKPLSLPEKPLVHRID